MGSGNSPALVRGGAGHGLASILTVRRFPGDWKPARPVSGRANGQTLHPVVAVACGSLPERNQQGPPRLAAEHRLLVDVPAHGQRWPVASGQAERLEWL